DAYGASKVTYRRVVSPGSGPLVEPVGADQHATIRIRLPGAGLPLRMRKSDQPAGGDTTTTSSAMLGLPPVAIAGVSTTWQRLSVSLNGGKSTFTLPVNEPMSTVCRDPFATEPPPMESVASLDAVTAPGASWPEPTDPSPR